MRKGSVQQAFVTVEDVLGDVLCLRGAHPHSREHRAVVAVESINFALKSEREQEAILAAYAAFLNGLNFPIQVLAQVRPLALQPYLVHVQAERARAREHETATASTAVWDQLTEEYLSFVAGLAAGRTILERRFFIIVPADTLPAERVGDPFDAFARALPMRCRKADPSKRQDFLVARQQLDLRVDVVIAALGRLGLVASRLGTEALLDLCQQVLATDRAVTHRVHADDLVRLGMPSHALPVLPRADAVEALRREQEAEIDKLLPVQEVR
jgi:hypothetical protein